MAAYLPGTRILLQPVADVTAILGVSGTVFLEMSGRWAMRFNGAGRITGALDLLDGVSLADFSTWQTASGTNFAMQPGFRNEVYRNNIVKVLFETAGSRVDVASPVDSGRFCGVTGPVPCSNNPGNTAPGYIITNGDGSYQFTPKFSGMRFGTNSPPTQQIEYPWQSLGSFLGMVTLPADPDPTHIAIAILDDGIQHIIKPSAITPPAGWIYSYSIVAAGPVITGCNNQVCLVYNAGNPPNERMVNITEFNINGTITAVNSFPAWGPPIVTDQNIDGPVMNLLGNNYNFCFQGTAPRLDLSVCGWDGPGGTAVDPSSGLPLHSGLSQSPFDIDIGGNYYTPLIPVEFDFKGQHYRMGPGNGNIRALTTLYGNVHAVVTFNSGPGGLPATLVMAGSLVSVLMRKTDTLNWKRSLTYGMRGPGTVAPGGADPTASGVIHTRGTFDVQSGPGPSEQKGAWYEVLGRLLGIIRK